MPIILQLIGVLSGGTLYFHSYKFHKFLANTTLLHLI